MLSLVVGLCLGLRGPSAGSLHGGLRQTVVALTYHDVVPVRTRSSLWFDCSVAELENQVRTMERAKVHFITVTQLYAYLAHGVRLPSRPVCITFADSYEGYYRYALPVLRRHHIPSAQFVHTGFVGSSIGRPKLTWAQLKEVDRAGDVTVASQTVSHPADLRLLSDARLRKEMVDSKRDLEAHLGHPVRFLAYPNGKFDARSERAARAAGYAMAFSERTQPANLSSSLFAVNRYVHTKWQTALAKLR
ncbi:MAG: polysaccharide deacetylase family protein [Fimbriimonadaceae bacterium]